MRQMAGDREHQIVVIRRHDLDPGAERGPERTYSLDGVWITALGWRQDAPAIGEQFGETGIGAGMLGARHWMRRYKMRGGRQIRSHVPHHGGFDRADVGNDRAR